MELDGTTDAINRPRLEESAFTCAITTIDRWRNFLIDNGSTLGMSFTQIAALAAIRGHGPIPSRALGKELRVTPGAVTQLVDVLVRQGLVERRENNKDRRVSEVVLTDKGAERLDEIGERRRLTSVEIFQVLSDEELETYRTVNIKMHHQLENLEKTHRKEG